MTFTKLLLASALFNSGTLSTSSYIGVKSIQGLQQSDDRALRNAWTLFAKAVIAGDMKMVKQLSASCVLCNESEYIESASNAPYVSIDRFIVKLSPRIFDTNTKARLLNSKKLAFNYDNNQNKRLYRYSCVASISEFKSATIPEVLVETVEESSRSGGMQKAFAFIKTKNGYKFCGYSTIP
ncbi:hypothetical protein KB206_14115 [Microvirga sp. STS02]|uniref:hypothetical protein n=1 Tax=Hymenobacter negativus TaxID=2795026 RepID=UPI0018DB5929|nr:MULTISPECIES: hypothetical protein [Bacteria]MBH8570021.1 hypothetical protein [Hymenobacter negativus]MBR7209761.1 hypothetical protein [Microvirga sp. STS02]